jgi:antitoxin (DNA-binding transcriptional repressor) of toxin-antitoxin stability system
LTNVPTSRKRSSSYNIAEAKARFSEMVQKAMIGEEVIIAKDHKPVLKLVALESAPARRKPGSAKNAGIWIADDFDAIPDDFQSYT